MVGRRVAQRVEETPAAEGVAPALGARPDVTRDDGVARAVDDDLRADLDAPPELGMRAQQMQRGRQSCGTGAGDEHFAFDHRRHLSQRNLHSAFSFIPRKEPMKISPKKSAALRGTPR